MAREVSKLETMVWHALDTALKSSNEQVLLKSPVEVAKNLLNKDTDIQEHFKHADPVVQLVLTKASVARWQVERRPKASGKNNHRKRRR